MKRASAKDVPCYAVFDEPAVDSARTYVILGVPRGGTSMVGGLARLLGLPLGDEIPNNHEDPDFNFDVLRRSGTDPVSHMKAAVHQRNATHAAWGWKYPRASHYLDELRPDLRNPHLVLVLRDAVASAGRHVGRGVEPLRAVLDHHALQSRNLDLVTRWEVPTLLVSYERSVTYPFRTAKLLASFLGMPEPTDRKRIREFVQPGTYQDVE